MLRRLMDWLETWNNKRRMHQVAHYWASQGSLTPYAAAAHELFLRHKLENFRDFASQRYLEDRSLTLIDIKNEWLDLVVKPMAKSEFTRDEAKSLKAAIVAITHSETFVGEAKKARASDIAAAIKTAKSGQVYTGRVA